MRLIQLRWILVLFCGAWLVSWGVGLRHGLGLFSLPIERSLGLGIEGFGLAIALQNLVWGLASPVFGAIADKWGTGRVVCFGTLLYALGLWVMGHSLLGVFLGQFLIGFGLAGTTFSITFGAVSRALPQRLHSIGLGIVSAAGSFGAFAIAPLEASLLDRFSLSATCAILALCALSMILSTVGLAERNRETLSKPLSVKKALQRAFKYRDYILVTVGFFVCGFQVVFIGAHLPKYYDDIGLSRATASWSLAMIGLFNIFGTLISGWLGGGRVRKKTLLTVIYSLRSLVILAFLFSDKSTFSALLFSAAIGLLWLSTIPPTSGLVLGMFGSPNMAMLYGIVFVSHQIGSFFGAWLGGFLYRVFGSYDPMWWLAIFFGLVAALLHYPIREPLLRPAERAA